MNQQQLLANLDKAVTAWIDGRIVDFRDHWLGPDGALVQYAHATACDFEPAANGLLEQLEAADHQSCAAGVLYDSNDVPQAAHLISGQIHAVSPP